MSDIGIPQDEIIIKKHLNSLTTKRSVNMKHLVTFILYIVTSVQVYKICTT